MVHRHILEKFGVTKKRLREIFEKIDLKKPDEDASKEDKDRYERCEKNRKTRELFEAEFRDLINEGVQWGISNYRFYAAVDLAWDTPAVSKTQIPLLLYAQGKIDLTTCAAELKTSSMSGLVKRDSAGNPTSIDLPKFVETSINLVRSIVTRRHAAQAVKYSNLYPYYKYESRSTGMVGKLKADVMSQESEIVVDGFGYRHHESQVMRDALLYGHSVDFIRSAWEVHKAYDFEPTSPEFKAIDPDDPKTIPTGTTILKEGISWTNEHPTRLIVDNAYPISAINDDVGPRYIGHWTVARYGEVERDPNYFNTGSISYGTGTGSLFSMFGGQASYFSSQFACTIKAPPFPVADSCSSPLPGGSVGLDPAGGNDRKNNIGIYSGEMKHAAMFKAEIFRKLIPANYGIAPYPFEIWVRFVVASDSTVIYAEPLSSGAAAVLSINESDARQLSPSFAHDVLWAQDMMSNLVTQMLLAVQNELLVIIGINTDLVSAADVEKIEARLKGKNWSVDGPIVIPVSLKNMADEMGFKIDAIFKIGETRQGQSVDVIFRAMAQLLALMDRLASMSPAEQGQPAPREISATEVTEIASTTQNVYSFISDSIDEYRAAKKRILYESTVCCKEDKVQVPVINRYSKETVKKAGFEVTEEDVPGSRPAGMNVTGDRKSLVHDYIFTSRDGAERPVNTQAANSLVQLMQVVLQTPMILQALGKQKTFDIFNEIFRLSGTGIDLNLEMQEGDSEGFGDDQLAAMQQAVAELQKVMQQLAQATEQNAQSLAEQEEVNTKQESVLQGLVEAANLLKGVASDVSQLQKKVAEKPPPEIPYRDAPEEIRRAQELEAGYPPPVNPTYIEEELAKMKGAKTSVVGQI